MLLVVGAFALISLQVINNGIGYLIFGATCVFLGYSLCDGRKEYTFPKSQLRAQTPSEIANSNKKFGEQ